MSTTAPATRRRRQLDGDNPKKRSKHEIAEQTRRAEKAEEAKIPPLAKEAGMIGRLKAGRLTGVHPSTVWRAAVEGVPASDGSRVFLRAHRFGAALYFKIEDLERFTRESAEARRKPAKEAR